MKKIFSFLLISAGLMIGTNAKAQVAKVGAQEFATLDLAWDYAEANGGTITLLDDVASMGDDFVMWHGKTVTLDLGPYSIAANKAFYIAKGQLNVVGTGVINFSCSQLFNVYGSNDPNEPYIFSGLNLGEGLVLNATADWGCAVVISGIAKTTNAAYLKCGWMTKDETGYNAFGVQIDINCIINSKWFAVSSNGQVNKKEGNVPVININETAELSDAQFTAGEEGAAIYAAGYCKWNINGAILTGATGIYAKAGDFKIEDAHISATGDYKAPVAYSNGMDASGDAMVFDSHGSYAGGINVVIAGETEVSSTNGSAIHEVVTQGNEEKTQSIILEGGVFNGSEAQGAINVSALGSDNKVVEVEGGSYSSNIENFLAPGTEAEFNPSTGKYEVEPAPSYDPRTLAIGEWGTVCYPEQIAYIKGAVAYEFVSNEGTQLGVAEVKVFEAGKAYLINATAAEQSVKYVKETTVGEPVANNGLVGTFEDITTEANAWIIKGNMVKPVAAGSTVPANRAYIPALEDVHTINNAVAARFFSLQTTELVELKGAAKVGKFMHRGHMMILREGVKYNSLGQKMK